MSESHIQAGSRATIGSVALAHAEKRVTQAEAYAILAGRYDEKLSPRLRTVMRKVFRHPSIKHRHIALQPDSRLEQICDETPDDKVRRFTHWAVELSCRAARDALRTAGVSGSDLSALVINTCTGYICPGITSYVMERLDFPSNVRALDLVGSGCGGAIPNLQMCERLLTGADDAALAISVEISTTTFQMDDDPSLVVSNALFADGAAAALISRRPGRLQIVDSENLHVPSERESIRYVHRNGQLRNQLSLKLPEIVCGPVGDVVRRLLGRNGLAPSDVRHWALHSGGEKIINAIQSELKLTDEALHVTRAVLENYGNMSSATVWYVLADIMENGLEPGEWCLMAAFGAGLSVHACLLQAS